MAETMIVGPDTVVALEAERTRSPRWALTSLSLAMLLSSLGTSSANVALPTLSTAFGASFQAVQWVVLAYLLTITVFIVSVGRLGDLIGRRRLLLAGFGLFAVASVLCGLAINVWMLIAARALQGLGAAVLMALSLAFIGETVPRDRTGSAMGLLGTMSATGTALGPSLGGLLIAGFGWRAIFLVNLPLGLLALYGAQRHLPRDRSVSAAHAKFDTLGTVLLASTLAAYALAMTVGRGSFGKQNLALLLTAAAAAALFVFAESKTSSPLVPLGTLRDPLLRAGLAMSSLVSTVVMATLVVGPFYLSGALGLDPARVGMVLSVGPLVAALTGAPAGRLVDHLGAHVMIVAGLVAMATGSLVLTLTTSSLGVVGYLAPIVVVTAGYAVFQAANNTSVMAGVGTPQRGTVSGMLNLSRNLGLITGASVMAAIYASFAGAGVDAAVAPEAAGQGMRVTFAVATLLVLAALVAAIRSRPSRRIGRGPGRSDAMSLFPRVWSCYATVAERSGPHDGSRRVLARPILGWRRNLK